MVKYAEYKRRWYLKKKEKLEKKCFDCGAGIIWKAKRCKKCAPKKRILDYPNTYPPNRSGKQKHLVGNKFREGKKPWNTGKIRPEMCGKNHPNWKGGLSKGREKEHHSLRYKQWRKAVFERDQYVCQGCGATKVYLEADHIKEWADYPELRYAVDNGQTLCRDRCHKIKTSNYMKGKQNAKK